VTRLHARRRPAALVLVLFASVAQGCGSPPQAATGSATPAVRGPHVVLPSGAVVTVELALTAAEKAQGLMYRESMPPGAGMIFPFDSLEVRPFWMKNCHFPLDIVHLTRDGTVVDVLENVPPCAADPCPTYPPAVASDTVLELNAGEARRNGVVRGARLAFRQVPGR